MVSTRRSASRFASLAWIAGAFLAACSSNSEPAPGQTVMDMLGRTCVIPQSAADPITCDQPPQPIAGCSSGATPCFLLGTTGDAGGPGAICAGCCSGNTGTSLVVDCVNLTCATPADCPPSYARCVSGSVCRF